jgi:D-serine deaminase-like pyridoxal phosphate-dependent protein
MSSQADLVNLPMSDVLTLDRFAHCDTPCHIVDAVVVERNIAKLAAYSSAHGLKVRPHTKTHKSRRVGQMQLNAGASGLTVAKPGEARVMADLDAEVLIAYPSVTEASLQAIRELSKDVSFLAALDSLEAIARLENSLSNSSEPVGVLVDIDVGLRRTGVHTPEESVALAEKVASSRRLRLDGIMCYPGHVWAVPAEQGALLADVEATLQAHIARWREKGLEARIVSGGSTPTLYQSHLVPSFTEIRPGTYVFNDMNTVRGGYCELADCAARVLATVVSDAVPGQVVIDAGAKTLAADRCIPIPESGQGHLVEYPLARITHLSEEHGQIDVTKCNRRPRVGDRVTVIPNHVCPTINLTDFVWWVAPEGMERLSIDARGMVR